VLGASGYNESVECGDQERVVHSLIGDSALAHSFHPEAFSYYGRLTPVLEFVEAHVAKPISLADAAKLAGLERKYFSVFFHSKVGTTFSEWLRIVRVTRAISLSA
jgi:transcriptional regulator GlxA family with amidase domain